MSQDQWERFPAFTFDVIEVNVKVPHSGEKLRIAIQICLSFLPVEMLRPIIYERFDVAPVGPVTPVRRIETVGQAATLNPGEYSIDDLLRNIDLERSHQLALRKHGQTN